MFLSRLVRLLTNLGVFVVLFLVVGFLKSDAIGIAALVAGAIGFAHQLCWDFLDFKFLDNKTGRIIKRVIFLAVAAFGVVYASSAFLSQLKLTSDLNYAKTAYLASPLPAAIGAIFLSFYTWFDDYDRLDARFISVQATIAGVVVGLVNAALMKYVHIALGLAVEAGLFIGLIVFIFIKCKRHSTFFYGEPRAKGEVVSSAPTTRTQKQGGNPGGYKEKAVCAQLRNYMPKIASRHSQTKSILYGVLIVSDVTANVDGANVTFTVDLKITGGTFKNQAEVDHAIGARDSYIKSLMNSIYSDAVSDAESITKSLYCSNFVGIEVKLGNVHS